MQLKIKLFGEMKCPKSYRIRDFLQRNGVRFQWTKITPNEDALFHTGLGSIYDSRFPVLKIGQHTFYAPTLAQIIHAVGWATTPTKTEYDLAIYGGGPAVSARPLWWVSSRSPKGEKELRSAALFRRMAAKHLHVNPDKSAFRK